MTTNSEFLKDQIEQKILSKIRNLDDCVRFDGVDTEYIFLNSATNEVAEVSIKNNIVIHKYKFFHESSKVLKTQTPNKLLCINWVEDEFIILRHLFEQSGLINYKINKIVPYEGSITIDGEQYFELIFSDVADLAMFEVYFQKLFDHSLDKDDIEKLKKMGLLK